MVERMLLSINFGNIFISIFFKYIRYRTKGGFRYRRVEEFQRRYIDIFNI